MVDVAEKQETHRVAIAAGRIFMRADTLQRIVEGSAAKGDVLGVARIAAIQGSKHTSSLIPLCHPVALTRMSVEFEVHRDENSVECIAVAETVGRTGVEMEALTAVSVGLLTVYDMCKTLDRGMRIEGVGLCDKPGGKPRHWIAGTDST